MKNKLLGVLLCLGAVLLPSLALAADDTPDIGCYEYGDYGAGIINVHPTYDADNFGGSGTVYYVSPDGSDAVGSGTAASPWKTLSYAATQVTEKGAVIRLAAGTYNEKAKTILTAGVSVEGAGDGSESSEAVTTIYTTSLPRLLPGSEAWYVPNAILELTSETNTNGDQHISGIRFEGDWDDTANPNAGAALEIRNRNNVQVRDCSFVDFALSAVGWRSTQVNAGSGAGTYATGCSFNDNIVLNCAGKNQTQSYYFGALFCGGLEGFLIYGNNMEEGRRDAGKPYDGGQAASGVPIKFWYYDGWMVDCKLYDNYIVKSWIPRYATDWNGWPFAIESTNEAGLEIYDNTIIGTVDTNFGERTVNGKAYDYSIYIHHNTIGPDSYTVNKPYDGICLEGWVDGVLIENNTIQNCCPAILAHSFVGGDITDLTIRYNLCSGVRTERSDWYQDAIVFSSAPADAHTITDLHIYNNTIIGAISSFGDQPANAIDLEHANSDGATYYGDNITVANNIISGFGDWWLNDMPLIEAAGYRSLDISITNNLFYANGALAGRGGTSPVIDNAPPDCTHSGDITAAPLFVSATDFHLRSSSPAIDAGKRVTTDNAFAMITAPDTTIPLPSYNLPFRDVKTGNWFYDDVRYVYEKGLMRGDSLTVFNPYVTTSRGMIVTILHRLAGEPHPSGVCPFTDVSAGSYYEKAVAWAATNGIIEGYSASKFGPNNYITREQLAAILYRYEQYLGGGFSGQWLFLLDFPDRAEISDYAYAAMSWMTRQGVIGGRSDGSLDPGGYATRAEAAAMIHRYCDLAVPE